MDAKEIVFERIKDTTIVSLLEFGFGIVVVGVVITTTSGIDDDEYNLTSSDSPKMQLHYDNNPQKKNRVKFPLCRTVDPHILKEDCFAFSISEKYSSERGTRIRLLDSYSSHRNTYMYIQDGQPLG